MQLKSSIAFLLFICLSHALTAQRDSAAITDELNFFRNPVMYSMPSEINVLYLDMAGFDSVHVEFKQGMKKYASRNFYFTNSGLISSHEIKNYQNDTLQFISTESFSREGDSVIRVQRVFVSTELNVTQSHDFHFELEYDSVDKVQEITTVYSAPSERHKVKTYLLEDEKQVGIEKNGYRYSFYYTLDGKLKKYKINPKCDKGYCPRSNTFIITHKGRKVKALKIGFPGSAPPHYVDKGKTNFHIFERIILKKNGYKHGGELDQLRIYKFNRSGYVKSLRVKTIVHGRFKTTSKLTYRYFKKKSS